MEKPNYAVRILVFTCVAHALTHIYLLAFTPLGGLMSTEFSTSYEEMTSYFFLCTLFFGLGAWPAGLLSDRYGEKALLVIFFLGCACGGTIVGLATTRVMLAIGFVTLGLATSIFHPVGVALITKGVKRRGRALGINGIAGSVGTALGPLVAGPITDAISWRWVFLLLAIPALILGIWMWLTDLGPAATPVPRPPQSNQADGPTATGNSGLSPSRLTLFFSLLAAMTFGGIYFHLYTMALPSYLSAEGIHTQNVGPGAIRAGIALTFGAIGQYVAGMLCDRRDERWLYVINLIMLAPLFFVLGNADSTVAIFMIACTVAIFMAAVQPIENSMLAHFTPEHWRGRIFGLKFILAFGVGGSGNWLAGIISERFGLSRVFELAALVATFALISAIIARCMKVRGS